MGKGKKKSGNQAKNQQDPSGSGSGSQQGTSGSGDKSKEKKNLENPNQPKSKQPVATSSGSQLSSSGSASGDIRKGPGMEVKKAESEMKSLVESFAEVEVTKTQEKKQEKKPKMTSEEWALKKLAKKGKKGQTQLEQQSTEPTKRELTVSQPSTSQMQQERSTSYGQPQQQTTMQGQPQRPSMQGYQQVASSQSYYQQPSRQAYPQQASSQSYQQHPSSRSYQQQPSRQSQQQQPTRQSQQQQRIPAAAGNKICHARGTLGYKIEVETNYLTLDLQQMPDVAYHYDVKIEPVDPKKDPKKESRPIPTKFLRYAFNAYTNEVWPNYHLAFDGVASAYSAQKLPQKALDDNEGIVISVEIDKGRENKFRVTLKPTADMEIDLKSLTTYQNDRIFDKPMRALQCIEVVLSTPCHKLGVRAGRSFFQPPPIIQDLGDGYELWYGLYQAAMLCDEPLLNVDVSHKSFPSQIDLVQFYNGLRRNPSDGLNAYLKGLSVIYNPPKCFKSNPKRYKFFAVAYPSNRQTFTINNEKYTVDRYFSSKGYNLRFPHLPCLHVGKPEKNIYIPLELISIPPNQAILRKDTDNQIRKMISYAATSTDDRKRKIMNLLQAFKFYADPVVERFGIRVGREFKKVEARVLKTPKIQYTKAFATISRPGEWQIPARSSFFLTTTNNKNRYKWAIINLSANINIMRLQNNFIRLVSSEANSAGMLLESECSQIVDKRNPGEVNIREELKKLKEQNINLVFVILPPGKDVYSTVKQDAEIFCGILTQCIKSDTVYKDFRGVDINAMTVKNILLKVNAKLNGINHTIANENRINLQRDAKVRIMFVGADVSHPSPLQKNMPSIVGVVASHDSSGFQYNMQYRLQKGKEETILDMKDIFSKHLDVYKSKMLEYPNVVIYYRDGVSDGQFKAIENVELNAMRAACKEVNCDPKFTCIIVVKRHHTRFFPKEGEGEGKFNNVQAGTVVDKTIIHPGEEQFFMVSHKSIQGTAKPTRYNVIVDESKIPIDDLQALTYNLCHLFPRCNRSVSYPTPAYLSHLVGLRGRAYIQGANLNLDKLHDEYSKREISKEIMKTNPMYFV